MVEMMEPMEPMEPRQTITTTAKTVEEATELALRELDVDLAEAEVNVVSKGKPGILGIGVEPAKVTVTRLDEPTDVIRFATATLQTLISGMGVDGTVVLKQANVEEINGPLLNIDSEDAGLLIGKRGETLRALQFLLRLLVSHQIGERASLLLDISDYQERRQQSLANMAQRIADSVIKTGQPFTLEPMPPNERRAIHVALSTHNGVSTRSVGIGDGRQIIVEPATE